MADNKNDIGSKFLNNELSISEQQKQEAIKKEEHFRKLYHSIYDLNSSKDFKDIAKDLVAGYDKMTEIYSQTSQNKHDIDFIIKFAFRDFFLLIFINMKGFFDNNEFLKELHKAVYFSNDGVNQEQFQSLVDYCRKYLSDNGTK